MSSEWQKDTIWENEGPNLNDGCDSNREEVQVKGPQAKPSHQAWKAQVLGGE